MNNTKHTRALLFVTLSTILFLNPAQNDVFGQASIRFAAVGDFWNEANTQSVANLVASWNPDFVITVGDNTYTVSATTAAWDNEVGQFYGQFIKYPAGSTSAFQPGPASNQFFPALGNHDWDAGIAGWNSYFELPGNERYYDFVQGPVHFFVVDSDPREPDGITSGSVQGLWLQTQLAASTSPWKIVYFHHPPYSSSSNHGNTPALQWPFQTWGATAVMSGHDHTYERILKNGFPYFVDGFGGRSLYGFNPTPESGSAVRYNANYGAMLIEANADTITIKSYSVAGGGTLIDTYTIANSSLATNDSTFTEAFDSFTVGQTIGTNPGWYDAASGPVVGASNGVASTRGLGASGTIFTWSAHPFNWNDPTFAKVTLEMDFESSSSGNFDDDRVGWMFGHPTTNSDNIFAVQIDSNSHRLEGYWDGGTTLDRRPKIDTLVGIVANTWYRLRAQITKLSARSARVDAWLIRLNASGDSIALAASGSIANTQSLGADSANHKYFTPTTVYAAFKNHTIAAADADNAYLRVSYASIPTDPTGLGATAISSSQINLAWTDNSDDETRFTIDRSTNGGASFDSLTSVATNTVVFSNTGLVPSTQYCYRVKAANGAGSSAYTGTACTTTLAAPPPTTENIVPAGSVWKYRDTGTNLGTTWRATSFDDGLWASGAAELGYGDGGEATVVNCGPSAPACNAGNFITTYFRRSFTIPDSSIYAGLTLRLMRDDGAVVYLNGLEIFRSNLPSGTIISSTLAPSAVGGADESAWFSTIVDPTNLRTGTNVLAVEVHQNSATSSDVSFDLQLIGSIVQNTSFRETFEGVTTPSLLNAHPEWRDDGSGPTVNTALGTGSSKGLTNAVDIFTWEAIPFNWNATSFQGAVFQMDFQSSAAAPFLDDDRLGWMITNTTAASVNHFGVQVDPIAANTTQNIEAYWDNQSNVNVRDTIVNITGLMVANTWYRLRLEVTKLGATAARLDVLLTQLDASGNPVQVIATGSVANTSLLPVADQPHTKYFTGSANYPAFKNFNNIVGNADNAFVQTNLDVPLPVQLVSFTASAVNATSVRLEWATLTETNNYGFEVQKSSVATIGYTTLPNSFIPGHGTTLEPHGYTYTDNTGSAGTWYYRLKQIDLDGTIHYSDAIQVDVLTGVGGESVPKEFVLKQNYPNPFNPTTSIEFHLPKATDVTLKIYNVLGSEVMSVLSNAKMGSGVHKVSVNASRLSSGLYIYRMTTPEFKFERKMVLLK